MAHKNLLEYPKALKLGAVTFKQDPNKPKMYYGDGLILIVRTTIVDSDVRFGVSLRKNVNEPGFHGAGWTLKDALFELERDCKRFAEQFFISLVVSGHATEIDR